MSEHSENGFRVPLPDGRLLGYSEFGASGGRPLFYFHGFCGSRLEARLADEAARLRGLRLIAVDRPGYGLSAPCPALTLSQWPRDVQALADHLGLEGVSLLGVSGGAPYALACAALLSGRIRRVVLACPLGPGNSPGLSRAWRFPLKSASLGGPALGWAGRVAGALLAGGVRFDAERLVRLAAYAASPADRRILKDETVRRVLSRSLREAFRQGGKGVARDLALYFRDWDFSLSEVLAPVSIWHGEDDRLVPVAMGRALASRLPDCHATFVAGEGHFSLPVRTIEVMLDEF